MALPPKALLGNKRGTLAPYVLRSAEAIGLSMYGVGTFVYAAVEKKVVTRLSPGGNTRRLIEPSDTDANTRCCLFAPLSFRPVVLISFNSYSVGSGGVSAFGTRA